MEESVKITSKKSLMDTCNYKKKTMQRTSKMILESYKNTKCTIFPHFVMYKKLL